MQKLLKGRRHDNCWIYYPFIQQRKEKMNGNRKDKLSIE